MPVFTIALLAVAGAVVTAFAIAFAWAQMHARPGLPAPIANRPRRRPF